MLSTYTGTFTYTRAQAVVDQVSALYAAGGFSDTTIDKICLGVEQRWLASVGLYLERSGKRVYELEARINWHAHSDQAELDFDINLPGWEGNASPEATILGSRFAAVAKKEGLNPRYWVLFTEAIRRDPSRHRELCPKVGVDFGSSVPAWASSPQTRSLPVQDLREIGMSERSAL